MGGTWGKFGDDLDMLPTKSREVEILEIFEEMATALRGSRQFKPNPRTEAFINKKREQLVSALWKKRK